MEWDANVQAFSVILTLCAFLLCVWSNGICNIYSLFMLRAQRSVLFVIYYSYQFVRYFPGIFKIRRDRLWRILFYTTNDRGTLCVGWFLRERWKCENLRCVRCASCLCCFLPSIFHFQVFNGVCICAKSALYCSHFTSSVFACILWHPIALLWLRGRGTWFENDLKYLCDWCWCYGLHKLLKHVVCTPFVFEVCDDRLNERSLYGKKKE